MIGATVSSWSFFFFSWLYRASPFGCKECNESDFSTGFPDGSDGKESNFGIDHLIMSICRAISCVVGGGCLLWPVCSLGKTLLAFVLLHFVLQSQTCLLLQVSLDFLLLHFIHLWWKRHLSLMLVLEGLVGLHRTIHLQLLQHYWLGHRLGLLIC